VGLATTVEYSTLRVGAGAWLLLTEADAVACVDLAEEVGTATFVEETAAFFVELTTAMLVEVGAAVFVVLGAATLVEVGTAALVEVFAAALVELGAAALVADEELAGSGDVLSLLASLTVMEEEPVLPKPSVETIW